jgi:phosphoglycerate kinase
MKLKSILQLKNLKNKTVLVRVDYNVALKKGKILETERIERSFATINYLVKKKAKVILMSHLGSPEGKKVKELSLKPIAYYMDSKAKKPVQFIEDCIGPKVKDKVKKLKAGQILLLENLRFYPGEEKNDAKFAQELAALANVYVNDAFSACHRAHASIAGVPKFLPSYAGINLVDEIKNLSYLLKGFKRPVLAVIGGVKISTKIKVIENLLKKYDQVLIGGALANNFFAANKINIGQSVFEKDYLKLAKTLQQKAKGKLILPLDVKIADKIKAKAKIQTVRIEALNKLKNKNFQLVDIGSKTEFYYESLIKKAKTIVWNGPMGIFEIEDFSHGTNFIAQRVAIHTKGPAFGAVGGGETLAVLGKLGLKNWPDFVSTGGGAMLEFLEGKVLPGIKPLIK